MQENAATDGQESNEITNRTALWHPELDSCTQEFWGNEMILNLTPLQISDALDMLKLFSDLEAVRNTNWPYLKNSEECVAKVKQIKERYESNALHFGPFIIRFDNGEFVGILDSDVVDEKNGEYEIWYFLDRKHWGRGLAKLAVQRLLEKMDSSGRVKSMRATAVVHNEASWKLLERHGFQRQKTIPGGHTKHGQNLDLYEYAKF